jgi:phosphomannomutase
VRDVSEIRFGTNGWRGVLGRDFSAEGAERLARALARALGAPARRPRVVVAFDTRAEADAVAARAARALAQAGAEALLCDAPTPTPTAGYLVRARSAAAGFVVTASHNPAEYLGVKILGAAGEGARRAFVDALAAAANVEASGAPAVDARARVLRDPARGYLARLAALVDAAPIHRARPRVLYDAMHGAGAGVADRAFRALGARVTIRRGAPDPRFGGGAPDPVRARLHGLVREVRAGGFDLGVASDGDADRFALVDARGRLFSETEALAVLVDHLAATRRLPRGLALSIATGSLAERAARAHGLATVRVGLGFSPLAAALQDGRADLAGEESGGFAWRRMGFDKDGILAGALALEAAASEPLAERLARLERAHGRSACGRLATPATTGVRRALARLAGAPPARVGGAAVRSVSGAHGLHAVFDDGFLLWRASGTEPVVRVYGEAPTRTALARRLAAGLARLR